MRVTKALHSFGPSLPHVIDIENMELDWIGGATLFAPSGTGKTTLFRLLAGWYESGQTMPCIWEPPLNPFKAVRFVGGHRSLLPWKTVKQHIRFQCPRLSGSDIPDLLDELGLSSGVSGLYPYELSLGMYKRIELMLAVLCEPPILLLDEFYSSIGDEQKGRIRSFLSKHRRESITWIVAHEEELRQWIGGPQFTFAMNGNTVAGIRRI